MHDKIVDELGKILCQNEEICSFKPTDAFATFKMLGDIIRILHIIRKKWTK